ncbi:MAG: hypothetical protein ACI9OJ_001073 [Myxococcota bacterium]|jgi:hypothetical protein
MEDRGDMKSVARQFSTQNDGEQELPADDQKPERRKGRRRSKTIALKRLTRQEIQAGIELADMMGYRRPDSRSQCAAGPRPCPYVACKHHLYLDVNPDTGSIKLNFPDVPVWDMKQTCALDIADRGGVTLEEVGEILNLTRERIRQVEVMGLEKLRETEFAEDLTGMKVVDDR